MPRRARVVIPGYVYHVTQRGNYQQKIFEEDRDRIVYLKLIEKMRKKYSGEIFAYCLMDNHVHFIVRPNKAETLGLMFGMAHMNYSLYLHRKHNCIGHLWQGRFYSCVMHGSHIREAVRYVECNPVRAGLVKRPWNFHWSSAKAHMGKVYKMIHLADIREIIDFGSWQEYLLEREDNDRLKKLREQTRNGYAWGPEKWALGLEEKWGCRLIARPRGRPRGK